MMAGDCGNCKDWPSSNSFAWRRDRFGPSRRRRRDRGLPSLATEGSRKDGARRFVLLGDPKTHGLHAVLGVLVAVDYTVGGAAVRPDEKQDVLAVGDSVHLVDEAVGTFDRVPVHFEDDIAGGKAGIISRAGGANAFDRRTFHLRGNVQLRTKVGGEVCHG